MKKYILLLLIALFVASIRPVVADEPRLAECDACGYCRNRTVPDNWKQCATCLYPAIVLSNPSVTAQDNQTLEIIENPIPDPDNPNKVLFNVPVPPAKGRYFTQLGCIDTSLSSFQDPGASGGVLNFFLSKLIFPAAGILAFLALVYGAFLLMTAQGEEFKIRRGKQFLTGAIVGLLFTFGVVLLINIIGGNILRIPGLSEGPTIQIYAAGNMATDDAGAIVYPRLDVIVNNKTITTLGQVTGNIQQVGQMYPNPGDYLPYAVNTTPLQSGDQIRMRFPNDYNPAGQYSDPLRGDVNIFIQQIVIDGQQCTITDFIRDDGVPWPPGEIPVRMAWNGDLICTVP